MLKVDETEVINYRTPGKKSKKIESSWRLSELTKGVAMTEAWGLFWSFRIQAERVKFATRALARILKKHWMGRLLSLVALTEQRGAWDQDPILHLKFRELLWHLLEVVADLRSADSQVTVVNRKVDGGKLSWVLLRTSGFALNDWRSHLGLPRTPA